LKVKVEFRLKKFKLFYYGERRNTHPMTASSKLKPARRMTYHSRMIRDPRPVMHGYWTRLWCRSMRP